MEKYYKEGKVAVLISPGYGAGWSTWNDDDESMVFDKELAIATESRYINKTGTQEMRIIASRKWPEAYYGGLEQLEIRWIDSGTEFKIDEYDGYEKIEYYANASYYKA